MSKFGKLKPSNWGRLGPVHNSLSHEGPWYYRDTEMVLVEYETTADAALAVLPDDLELVEPATVFMIIETNHWTTLGPYSEVYLGILCKWKGEMYGYVPGVYVTGENSQIVGREVYGFGKKMAHRVEVMRHPNGSVEAVMEITPGERALQAIMRPRSFDKLAGLPLLCLRVVPDAEGGPTPALAQLVSVEVKVTPLVGSDGQAEIFSGPGELRFDAPSDVQFPVKKMLKCTYAHFNADLPYGKVLKTFSKEELAECK